MPNVSSNSFPPGTKVFMFPLGSTRPGEGTDSADHKTVGKDGLVAFHSDDQLGRYVWLAGEVADEWLTVQVPVKDGKPSDAKDPGETLAKVAAPIADAAEDVHGARTTQNTRQSAAKAKRSDVPVASLSGAEALHESASGSGVSIPAGSHADPEAF